MLRKPFNTALLVLFSLSSTIAFIDHRLEVFDSAELEAVIRQLYQSRGHHLESGSDVSSDADDNRDCACAKNNCGCCVQIRIRKPKIDDGVCVNVTFLSEQLGIKLAITLNGREVYSNTISIHDPPPICFKVTSMASACVYLYDLVFANKVLKGCSRIEVKTFGKKLAELKLGCFTIPLVADDTKTMTLEAAVKRPEILKGFETVNKMQQQQPL